jgi:hypothetical protein
MIVLTHKLFLEVYKSFMSDLDEGENHFKVYHT